MSAKPQHNSSSKDVIYIDVDDEITAIIDKVHASKHRIVALVLPKRAAAFQSVVNMKLLKRSADHVKKHVVLITGDANLMPLAGDVGLHVAKSLQSKPEVPDAPESDTKDSKAEAVEEPDEPSVDAHKTLAELNGDDEEETIELGDLEEDMQAIEADQKAPKKKHKKFKIPNFNRFRLMIIGGSAGLVLLIFLIVMAFVVLPKARIVISTDSSVVTVSKDVTLKVGETVTLDTANAVVPATKQDSTKTVTQEVATTGQQNNGEKAAGSVTMTAKNCTSLETPKDVPKGTGITVNGKTYITGKTASFNGSGTFDGSCLNFKDSNITIEAQSGGASFNVDSASFTVAGRTDVTATGSASGGTDNIIKTVSQVDVDGAKQKIGAQDIESVRLELTQSLQDRDFVPIETTFTTTTPTTTLSANVGDVADTVTVTQEVVYSMLGVKRSDLEALATDQAKDKIDLDKQSILDYGLDEAVFTQLTTQPDGATIGFQTKVVAGTDLKADEIKGQIAGKKANDARELIKSNPGVTEVEVTYSPFWVSSIPKKTSKITVVIQEPQTTDSNAQSSQ